MPNDEGNGSGEEGNSEDDFQEGHRLFALATAHDDGQEMSLNQIRDGFEPQFVNVAINGKSVHMELDSRAAVATMSKKDLNKFFPTVAVEELNQKFCVVGGAPTKPSGVIRGLDIEFNGVEAKGDCYIVEAKVPILSWPWLKKYGMSLWPGLGLGAIEVVKIRE